ncbi:hypothetical protein [Bradyrhizobium canariense]|uniref:hypothetical protein n=1 Tax=Bradyrhizobium canariense TaxID=255045 RepID=UPI000A197D1B|nr:hypothetical protein [Bradyrhizobium canariense]
MAPVLTQEERANLLWRMERLRNLAKRAKVDPTDHVALVEWFTRQHFRWALGTLVQYGSALREALDRADLADDVALRLKGELETGPTPLPRGADKTQRIGTCTDGTLRSYRARASRLFVAAGVDPIDHVGAVRWFSEQHFQWAPSTIVQYRAALRQSIEDGDLDPELAQRLERQLEAGPIPRNSGPPRTSARKRKSLPREQFVELVKHLEEPGRHVDDVLAAKLLRHNVLLFLRRVEWETATVQDGHLVIQNAKATNGRSIGPQRSRDLSEYGKPGMRSLRALIGTLKRRSKEIEAEERQAEGEESVDGFAALWGRLSARIARACKQIGIKRVSIYTTRHVGMANAKSWMPPEEVAASAGHKTTATAASHYAKRSSGWGAKVQRVARPAPDDVKKVIKSPKWNRQANVEYYRERAERLQEADDGPPAFSI